MLHELLDHRPTSRRNLAALYAFGLLVIAAVELVDPAGSPYDPKCPFRAITGLSCPGCGGLRALHEALHGHLGAAIRLNPILAVLVPIFGYGVLDDLSRVFRSRALSRPRIRPAWWLALALIVGVFWVVRNIPCYPFTVIAG
jgi:hypothetical protein